MDSGRSSGRTNGRKGDRTRPQLAVILKARQGTQLNKHKVPQTQPQAARGYSQKAVDDGESTKGKRTPDCPLCELPWPPDPALSGTARLR